MAKIDTLGTLTIAANASMSAAMDKSVYDSYEAISIFPPTGFPAGSGSAVLLATPETASFITGTVINNNHWYLVKNTGGTNITVTSSPATVAIVAPFPFENICLSGSVLPTSDMIYTVQGQREVALTGISAVTPD